MDIARVRSTRANFPRGANLSWRMPTTLALPNQMRKIYFGHHLLGLAAIISGVTSLIWRDLNAWKDVIALEHVPHPQIFLYITGAIQLVGGILIQWRHTRRIGALLLGVIYLIFTLLWVPEIVASPLVWGIWGALFYPFSLLSGALMVYGMVSPSENPQRLTRIGYVCFGICQVPFAIEQLAYFSNTVVLVPKWIPPGQVFWAIATTIAFGLAAVALLSGRSALLAARLLTVMLIAFGLLIWIPTVASNPHKLFNWTEHNENLAIAGVAWIVTDYVVQKRSRPLPSA